jgi:hypothetical protein
MKSASISLLSLDARASWQGSTSQSQSIRVSRVPSGHPTVPSSFAPLLGAKNKARVDQGGGQEAALQARSRCEGSPLCLSTESTRGQPTFAMLQSRLDSFHAACHLKNRSAINLAGGFPRKELSSSCFVGGGSLKTGHSICDMSPKAISHSADFVAIGDWTGPRREQSHDLRLDFGINFIAGVPKNAGDHFILKIGIADRLKELASFR